MLGIKDGIEGERTVGIKHGIAVNTAEGIGDTSEGIAVTMDDGIKVGTSVGMGDGTDVRTGDGTKVGTRVGIDGVKLGNEDGKDGTRLGSDGIRLGRLGGVPTAAS